MKSPWQTKKLGDVCEMVNRGVSPKYTESNGLVVLNQKCIRDHLVNFELARLHDEKSKEVSSDKIIRIGDGLVNSTGTGTLGRVALVKYLPTRATADSHITILRPTAGIFDLNFFGYCLVSIEKEIEKLGDGCGGQIELSRNTLKNDLRISYPDNIHEQQRIVKILDSAFESIAKSKFNAEKNRQNSKDVFETYLQNIFDNSGGDWDRKRLVDVLQKTETIDPTKKPNDEFIYLDVSSVNKDTKQIENTTVLMGKNAPSRARKLIKTNDVIFATVRPTHSRVALITEDYNNQVCSTGYFVLRTKDTLNSNLIYYFLLTRGFNRQMEEMQKGASYPAVNDNEVKNILITFPKSIVEQKIIVAKLDKLSSETKELELIYQQKLADLEELKKSILNKAFNGEL